MTKKNEEKILTDKECNDIFDDYINSKGSQKMWNYFLDITKKDYFKETIKNLREKYKVPSDGLDTNNESYTMPPENISFDNYDKLRQDLIDKICIKYRLHPFDYSDVLLHYVYYNILQPLGELGSCGLFRVCDIPEEKVEPFGELFELSDDLAYPIAIRISPYASQRDIIDFVKNKAVWKREIEYLQNKYKDKNIAIGKVKSKNKTIQERNDFIYQNKNKSLKEIRKLLADKNIFLDDGHIAKILSLERQKRKDV